MSRGVAKGVFVARKALLAVCFQSVQCGNGCMWQSCGGVSRAILALTIYKTQKRVKRQLRFDKGVAKDVFIARKALLADYFQSVQSVGGRAVMYHGNYLR